MRNIKHRTKKQAKEAYNTAPDSSDKMDILKWLIKTDFVTNYIQKLTFNSDYGDLEDITQDIWMIICEIEQDKWNDLYEQGTLNIIRYISGLIYRQVNSTTSTIYKRYKGYKEHYLNITDTMWNIYNKTNIMKNEAGKTQED